MTDQECIKFFDEALQYQETSPIVVVNKQALSHALTVLKAVDKAEQYPLVDCAPYIAKLELRVKELEQKIGETQQTEQWGTLTTPHNRRQYEDYKGMA